MSEERTVEYSDHADFNVDFDFDNAEVKIGSLPPYKASYVLYHADYEAYLDAIKNYNEKKEDAIKDTILYNYPQPISYYFHQAENGYSNNNHRLQLLRSTWEAIIFTLYAVVIGEARSKNLPLRDIAIRNSRGNFDLCFDDYFSDSLAKKLLIIERILNFSSNYNISLHSNNIISLQSIQNIRTLNQSRNEFMHTAALSEEQASHRYSELYPEVFDVLTDLTELASLDIMRYVENAGSVTALRCELFRGYSLARKIPTIQINPSHLGTIFNELNDQNILVSYQDDIFSVTPFYHFNTEANGNRTNLCYCKKRLSSTRYEYEIVTRSESYEVDGTVFTDRVNELRGLII